MSVFDSGVTLNFHRLRNSRANMAAFIDGGPAEYERGAGELLAGYVARNHPLPRMMTAAPLSYSRTCCGR